MSRRAASAPRAGAAPLAAPGRPLWLTSLAYAALATALICFPAWPGHMSYDSLYAWSRSIEGIEHMTWPPMHSYLFWLSRRLGLGPGGLFVGQTFLLLFAAALAVGLVLRSRILALAAMAGFAAAFVVVPPMLGVAMVQWRDVTVGAFALASVALWLLASRQQRPTILAPAALALGVAVSLRYNAFPLFALIVPAMVWRPLLAPGASHRLRAFTALLLILAVGLAWASTQWRLPDFKRLPHSSTLAQIQMFDLLGVSACEDRNFLPSAVTAGWAITPDQIRKAYDPRHVQRAHRPVSDPPPILPTDGGGTVQAAWREVIPRHLGCYLDHRRMVMVEQLGLAERGVFYPTHPGIDPNPYGLELARPALSAKVTAYVERNAPALWRRPALLYALALAVCALLALRRDPRTALVAAITGGAFANIALLFLIGPAADARYVFPSNVFCAFIIAAGAAMLVEGPRSRTADAPRTGRRPRNGGRRR